MTTNEHTKRIYEDLKRLWLMTADESTKHEAEREFDGFIQELLAQGAEAALRSEDPKKQDPDQPANDEPEVTQSRMLMEIILEMDTAMRMVPPRVKTYRDLLAAEGLDRTTQVEGDDGMKGIAGINLADQAALEFHRSMLGLSVAIAQAEVQERIHRAGGHG